MRSPNTSKTDRPLKPGKSGGLVLCLSAFLLSLLLWAGFAWVWKPGSVAPWRFADVHSLAPAEVENPAKHYENTHKEPQPNRTKNNADNHSTNSLSDGQTEPRLSQDPVSVVATTNAETLSTGADSLEILPLDQNILENQQVKTEDHQFNVTIKYNDASCLEKFGHSVSVPILFKHGTAALKSRSLSELEAIVKIYHQCANQRIAINLPIQFSGDVRASLRQRREDEVRYYLLHMRIDEERIRLPDTL